MGVLNPLLFYMLSSEHKEHIQEAVNQKFLCHRSIMIY